MSKSKIGNEINPEDCAFYGQFDNGSNGTKEFFEVYPAFREKGQIIIASKRYIVIPDIAPVTTDHLLVIPKNHFRSFASLPQSFSSELKNIITDILRKMKEFHPNSEIIAFEHGMGTIGEQTIMCGGCGRTEHAHLHILPIPAKIKKKSAGQEIKNIISKDFGLIVSGCVSLPEFNIGHLTKELPYLYLWSDALDSSFVFIQDSTKVVIPSQLIRRLLAEKILGVKENEQNKWDWKEYILFNAKQGQKTISDTLNRWGTIKLNKMKKYGKDAKQRKHGHY